VSFLVHALVVIVVGGAILVLSVAASYLVVRRLVRRRWRRVRDHAATRGVLTAASVFAAWRERQGSSKPSAIARSSAARARRTMWVAVEDAERAVRHAQDIDAPVAELPAVCRRLRGMADDLDHLLRLEGRLPAGPGRPVGVRSQVAELIHAARDVQLAALEVGSDASDLRLRSVVGDARDEVEVLAAALTRMRSVL
jgi:hypothetical protein